MSEQCQSCGSFAVAATCAYCTKVSLCGVCRPNHEGVCETLQKAKQRGEGPTIANVPVPEHRAGHQPVEAGPADRPVDLRRVELIPAPPSDGPRRRYIDREPREGEVVVPPVIEIDPPMPLDDAPTQDEIPVYDVLTGETTERGAKPGTDPEAQQDLEENK